MAHASGRVRHRLTDSDRGQSGQSRQHTEIRCHLTVMHHHEMIRRDGDNASPTSRRQRCVNTMNRRHRDSPGNRRR